MASNISTVKTDKEEYGNNRGSKDFRTDAFGEAASKVYDKATDKVSELTEKAGEFTSTIRDKAQEAISNVPGLVRKYPVQAMLFGFGAGLLVARAFIAKSKTKEQT